MKKTDIIDGEKLYKIIKKILGENPKAANDYKSGKIQVIGFLIGKVKQSFPKKINLSHKIRTLDKF